MSVIALSQIDAQMLLDCFDIFDNIFLLSFKFTLPIIIRSLITLTLPHHNFIIEKFVWTVYRLDKISTINKEHNAKTNLKR